ncbi:MAG: hypothetical protein HYZ89_00280 [Candidatus Omnitrophica bacterium]|nr:hypothetical protein [Candidatus Omnitrophota bacterium]
MTADRDADRRRSEDADGDADRRRSISGYPRSAYQRVSASSISGHLRSNQRSSAFKGQNTLEYAVVLAAVSAALLAMKLYVRRGIAGELRRAADSVGEQYDPRNTTGKITLGSHSDTTTTVQSLNEIDLAKLCCVDQDGSKTCGPGEPSKKPCSPGDPPLFPVSETIQDGETVCVDLNGNKKCDKQVFATLQESLLNDETVTRTGEETVGALGNDLWN